MPFIAIDNDSGERIDMTEILDPKGTLVGRALSCQLCGAPMSIKASEARLVDPHFFHVAECSSTFKSHPESREHRRGKIYVSTLIADIFENHFCVKAEKELPIPEVNRVSDLVLVYRCGWMLANEIQLSKTTIDDLSQRQEKDNSVVFWKNRIKVQTIYEIQRGLDNQLGRILCA